MYNFLRKKSIYYLLPLTIILLSIISVHAYLVDKKDVLASFDISKTVTATFDSQGGAPVESITKFPGKTLGELPITTKDGSEFVEWNTAADGTGETVTSETVLLSDVTYYAKWKSSIPEITLLYNDGVTSDTSIKTTTANDLPTPLRTGYTFGGWYVAEEVDSITINSFSNPNSTYPWTQDSDGVWSSGNQGVGSSTSDMISEEFTLTEAGTLSFDWRSYGENNYDYLGYDIYNVDTGTYLSNQSSPTYRKCLKTLKGKASTDFVTETYELEAGRYQLLFMYGKDSSINKNDDTAYVKNIMSTGSIGYQPSETYRPDTFTTNMVLITKWTPIEYTYDIVYVSSTGKQLGTTTATYDFGTTNTISPKTFAGYSSPDSQKIIWDSTTSKTITFTYTPSEYGITVNLNGGSGVSSSTYTIESNDITLGTPTRTGYTFDGWTGSNGTTANKTIIISKGSTGDKEYTANWTPINYSITYNLNGGTQGSGATTNYTIESNAITLPTPTRTDYTFGGWYETSTFTGTAVTTISKGSTGNKTYYAKWISDKEVFAVYSADDNSLSFYNRSMPTEGSTFNGKTATAVYTGIEELAATSSSYVPWNSKATSITSVEVIDEINPISTSYWFYNFTKCESFDLSKLYTSKITTFNSMFYKAGYNASTFEIQGLDTWDTSKVTDMNSMFYKAGYYATTFNIGDLSGWTTSKVTDMRSMFDDAGYKATTFDIGNLSAWNTSAVSDMSYMFRNSGAMATTWNIGNLSNWNTSQVTNMSNMFSVAGYYATTWSIGDLSKWDTSKVTDMNNMFSSAGYESTTWNIGDLSNWNTSKVTNMSAMFSSAGRNTTTFEIKGLEKWDTSKVTDMSNMFYYVGHNASKVSLNIGTWNTTNVTNMEKMFYYAGKYATTFIIGDLSAWNTTNVTNMRYMFYYAGYSADWSLDCSGWNVNKVTDYTNFNGNVKSKVTAPTWVN